MNESFSMFFDEYCVVSNESQRIRKRSATVSEMDPVDGIGDSWTEIFDSTVRKGTKPSKRPRKERAQENRDIKKEATFHTEMKFFQRREENKALKALAAKLNVPQQSVVSTKLNVQSQSAVLKLDQIKLAFCTLDPSETKIFNIIYASPEFCRLSGYPSLTLLSVSYRDLPCSPSVNLAKFRKLEMAIQSGHNEEVEVVHQLLDGSIFYSTITVCFRPAEITTPFVIAFFSATSRVATPTPEVRSTVYSRHKHSLSVLSSRSAHNSPYSQGDSPGPLGINTSDISTYIHNSSTGSVTSVTSGSSKAITPKVYNNTSRAQRLRLLQGQDLGGGKGLSAHADQPAPSGVDRAAAVAVSEVYNTNEMYEHYCTTTAPEPTIHTTATIPLSLTLPHTIPQALPQYSSQHTTPHSVSTRTPLIYGFTTFTTSPSVSPVYPLTRGCSSGGTDGGIGNISGSAGISGNTSTNRKRTRADLYTTHTNSPHTNTHSLSHTTDSNSIYALDMVLSAATTAQSTHTSPYSQHTHTVHTNSPLHSSSVSSDAPPRRADTVEIGVRHPLPLGPFADHSTTPAIEPFPLVSVPHTTTTFMHPGAVDTTYNSTNSNIDMNTTDTTEVEWCDDPLDYLIDELFEFT